MSLDTATMVAGSMAANPKPWTCIGCTSLFGRQLPGTPRRSMCGHPALTMPWASRGRALEAPASAAPHWCPRTTAPLMAGAAP